MAELQRPSLPCALGASTCATNKPERQPATVPQLASVTKAKEPQKTPHPFPLPTSNTEEVCAWLKNWHEEHLIYEKPLSGIVIWDGYWIYEKSGEQLKSELKKVLNPLCAKMIVETIVREGEVCEVPEGGHISLNFAKEKQGNRFVVAKLQRADPNQDVVVLLRRSRSRFVAFYFNQSRPGYLLFLERSSIVGKGQL